MGTKVYVLGAGGFGREVLQYLLDLSAAGAALEVAGFLDDDPDALDGFDEPYQVVGSTDDESFLSQDVVIAVGNPLLRCRLRRAVEAAGGTLVSVIHPTAWVAPGAQIAPGCIIAPKAFVSVHSHVGPNVVINAMVTVGHDASVGADAVLSPHTALSGAAKVGEGVFTGTRATVTPGISVGPWSRLAAGACVTRDLPAGSLAAGNPAKSRVMFEIPADETCPAAGSRSDGANGEYSGIRTLEGMAQTVSR